MLTDKSDKKGPVIKKKGISDVKNIGRLIKKKISVLFIFKIK